jgi:hypothetical protein
MMPDRKAPRSRRNGLFLLCAALAVGVALSGIWIRQHAEAELAQVTDVAAVPTVEVAIAAASPAEEEIVLPGTVQALYDIPHLCPHQRVCEALVHGYRRAGEGGRSLG